MVDRDGAPRNTDFRERVKLRVRMNKCRDKSHLAQVIVVKLLSAYWALPWEWLILLKLKITLKVKRLAVITVLPNHGCNYFGHCNRITNLKHLFLFSPNQLEKLWNLNHFSPFLPSYQQHYQLSLYWLYWLYHNSPTAPNLTFLSYHHLSQSWEPFLLDDYLRSIYLDSETLGPSLSIRIFPKLFQTVYSQIRRVSQVWGIKILSYFRRSF
jgi:hypothetical protein